MRRIARFLPAVTAILAVFILGGCFLVSVDPGTAIAVEIAETAYGYEATFDFGIVEPGSGPVTVAARIVNILDRDVTVTGVAADDTAFAAETPAVPFTVAAGDSVEASLSFDPESSAVYSAELSVDIDGAGAPFVITLTGVGNYPPVASEAVVVTGAGDETANGIYYRDGVRISDNQGIPYPYYENPETGYRIYAFDGDGIGWSLDASTDGSLVMYGFYPAGPIGPSTFVATNDEWDTWNAGTDPPPTSVGPFTMPNPDWGFIDVGETITASYVYDDAEGDLEGATVIQWYHSDTDDPDGSYTPIPGANSLSYVPDPGDDMTYLKVEIIPYAESGLLIGSPLVLGPTPIVMLPN
jgi:hypothetical protein